MAKPHAAAGSRIRAQRLLNRLLQKQVADLIGLTEVEYNALEMGEKAPSEQTKEDLSNLYPTKPKTYWDEDLQQKEKKPGSLSQIKSV